MGVAITIITFEKCIANRNLDRFHLNVDVTRRVVFSTPG